MFELRNLLSDNKIAWSIKLTMVLNLYCWG